VQKADKIKGAAALFLTGAGASPAAACYTGPFPFNNTGTIACIQVTNQTFTGYVTNSNVITPGGITVTNSNITGGIADNGFTLDGGIAIESHSVITGIGTITAVEVSIHNFSGGISNAGVITDKGTAVSVGSVTNFSGGITNSGSISAGRNGVVLFGPSAFAGGITNGGRITSTSGAGIGVFDVSTFGGGIQNNGALTAPTGILVGFPGFGVPQFSGGIVNRGVITTANTGIGVTDVGAFTGGIVNSGSISAKTGILLGAGDTSFTGAIVNSGSITGDGGVAIDVRAANNPIIIDQTGGFINGAIELSANADVLNVTGGAINGDIIGEGTKDTVNFAPGPNIFSYSNAITGVNNINFNAGTTVLNGEIGGAATLTIAPAATLLIGSNTASIAPSVANNGLFGFAQSGAYTFGDVISGTGSLEQIGAGATTLTGANSYSGGTSLTGGGALVIGNNSALGRGVLTMANGTTLSFLGTGDFNVANNIQITGSATFTPPLGTSQTLAGNISNGSSPGTFNMGGAGTLVLSGASAYTGPTNVNSGVLRGGAANAFAPSSAFTVASSAFLDLGGFNQVIGSLSGGGVVENTGAGLAVLAEGVNNASTVFSGVIKDDAPMGLTKTGDGTLTLSGVNTYTGPTGIESGVLNVTGSIGSSNLTTVMGGATLTGSGATGATMVKPGGVLAPGSGVPGSAMSVLGDLGFNSAAIYQVAINSTTASLANVKGSASLSGDVLADFSPGSYLARKYTILTTTGGLGGTTFSGLAEADAPAGFAETLTYDSDNVYLDLIASLGAQGGLNTNQQNVANALNAAFNNGASLPPGFVNLYALTGAGLGDALTQITGEAAASARQGDFLFTDMFLSLLVDPYPENRGGGHGEASGPGAATGCSQPDGAPDSLVAPDSTKKPQAAPPCEPRWNVWAAGFGGGEQTNGDSTTGSHNAQIGAGGGAVGADYRFSPDATLGFALAGGTTNWSLSDALGGGSSNVFQGALYGAYQFGPAYLAGALTLGDYWLTTNRTVALSGGGTYRATFNSTDMGGRVESGYHVILPLVTLTPYAAIQPQTFHAPSYVESSAFGSDFALNYASQSATDTRFELGAWVDKNLALSDNGVVRLFGRLAWTYDWQSNPALTATFQDIPTASFVVNGAKPAPNQALIAAGLEWRFSQNWSMMAKFEGEFGAGSETYAATGRINYTW
jgi:autotransporter-associated beta strand protein